MNTVKVWRRQEETAHAPWLEAKFLPVEISEKVGAETYTF